MVHWYWYTGTGTGLLDNVALACLCKICYFLICHLSATYLGLSIQILLDKVLDIVYFRFPLADNFALQMYYEMHKNRNKIGDSCLLIL